MIRVQSQTQIARRPDQVFEFVAADFFGNYPRWSPEVVALEQTSSGPVRIGSTGRQVRIDWGRRTEASFRVSRFEPGRCVAFQGISSPFHIRYSLDPVGEDTRLTFTFEITRLAPFLRPFEKLLGIAMKDGAERVVRNLRSLIESDVPPAGTGTKGVRVGTLSSLRDTS
jgi:hypothetical protein